MARHRSAALRGRNRRLAGSAVAAGVVLAVIAGHAHAPGGGSGGAGQMGTAASNVALGQSMAAARGWTDGEWTCLNELWTRESGWRTEVWNTAGSGAYGIPQALPASKMAAAGADYMTSPATQIRWGLGYIAGRYGDPCGAWSHETSAGWY